MNFNCRQLFLLVLCCYTFTLKAQTFHEDVLPNLTGNELAEALIEAYTPDSVIDYGFARDTLFLKIDAVDRNLSCIYTGLTLPIPEGSDPTQAVFLNGDKNGINTEHVFPQGFFADNSPAESDMHNLYPSRVKTNGDRGNHPFGESPDLLTDIWYILSEERNTIPPTNINDYSEIYLSNNQNLFEPREKVKGDIARSMFYIFSIYKDITASPDYFEGQKETLCNWHFQDPVDEVEWTRTQKIAAYQGNKNPFVLDCTVAQRLYCESDTESCKPVSTTATSFSDETLFTYDFSLNEIRIENNAFGSLTISTLLGSNVFKVETSYSVSLNHLPKGNYIANFTTKESSSSKLIQVR